MSSDDMSPLALDDFRSIIASSVDGFTLINSGGKIIDANTSYCQFLGYTREELVKMHMSDIDAIDTPIDVANRSEEIIRKGSLRFETKHLHKNGSIIDVEVTVHYSDLHGGSFFSIVRDMTQHKQISETNRFLSEIMRNAAEGVVVTRIDNGTIAFTNSRFEKMFGYEPGEMTGKDISTINAPNEKTPEETKKTIGVFLEQAGEWHGEIENIKKDGTRFWCHANISIFDSSEYGRVYLSIHTDITDRKKAEKLLLNEKALLRSVIDSTTDLIYFKDSNGIYLGCNKASEKFIGIAESEQIGKSDFDILEHEIADQVQEHDKMVLQGGCSVRTEHWIPCLDGSKVFMDTVKTPIFGIDQQPIGLVGISRDITERKKAEEELIQSNEQLKFVLEGSQLGFWDWNMETGEVVRNEQWSKMLGYTFSEIDFSTTQWTNLIHPDDRDRAWQSIKDHIEGRAPLHKAEYRMLAKDGQYRWILDQARIVKYSDEGKPLRMCGTHTDIYESKKAEEEKQILEQRLQHTQKLESLGVLSGGIAHDFNNILAIIMGYCSLTKLNYETAERNIPIIEDAAEKAAGLCRQMLAYAGKAQLTKTKINMLKNVEEIVAMLKATLPQNAVIKTDLSTEIPLIEGDANQLRQVVMNLIINASEAIGTEHGEVDVSLTRIKVIAGKEYEDYHGKPIPFGEYVCLEVTDNGCGMDEEAKWRIFEPFYTTKFTGRGLGMSAVLGIIKSHAGALQLFSQPGQGTTFKVYLPAPANEVNGEENQIESTPPVLWHGSGTILLVEDEESIRDIAKNFLEFFGFTVLEAVNGREALEIYQKNASEITLVITDMGMPIMDGYELFHKLKSLNSELPIIVSSGYGDVEVSSRIGSDNIAGIISKPYNPEKLRDVLKRVMEGLGG